MSAQAAASTMDHAGHHHDDDGHGHGPIQWPAEHFYGHASAGKLGMWIFLLSDCLSFAGLLLAYGILRGGSSTWHQPGEPALGINFTAGLTFLLICSSVTMVLAYAAAVERNKKQLVLFLALTVLGGLMFLGGQVIEYTGLAHEGLHFGQSTYASTFYVITSFHGGHVTAGTIYNLVMLIGALRGKYSDGNAGPVELAGLFWHFVDLIWILVFTFVYLL